MSNESKRGKKPMLASYGREVDIQAAFREARRLLTPSSQRGGHKSNGNVDLWRLDRAQWHYDYGNRALAERELKHINEFRAARDWDNPGKYPPMELRR